MTKHPLIDYFKTMYPGASVIAWNGILFKIVGDKIYRVDDEPHIYGNRIENIIIDEIEE